MKTILTILLTSFTLLSLSSFGQIKFEKAYGGTGNDFGYSVKQTTDKGFILLGSTHSFGAGSRDLFLIRTNEFGDTLWTRTYGGVDFDSSSEVHQTFDGGFILCGSNNLQPFVVKTNETGDTTWTRRFDHNGDGHSIQQTQDGGYILGGIIWMGNANYDMLLIKLKDNGETLWTKTFGVSSHDACRAVIETNDGGFLLAGHGQKDATSLQDMYLVKTDSEGNVVWEKYIGGTADEIAFDVEQTSDGGYILVGESNSFGDESFYIVKTNDDGESIWEKTYFNGNMYDEGYEIKQTPEGGYAFVGEINESDTSGQKVHLIRTDSAGEMLWEKTYEQGNGNGLDLTTDGGYVLIGFSIAFGLGVNDIYLIKTDSNGVATPDVKTNTTLPISDHYEVTAFPNPFDDFTTITIDHPNIKNHTLRLFDKKGQLVRRITNINSNKIFIDKKNLLSGLYFFQLVDKNKIVTNGKLVVK